MRAVIVALIFVALAAQGPKAYAQSDSTSKSAIPIMHVPKPALPVVRSMENAGTRTHLTHP